MSDARERGMALAMLFEAFAVRDMTPVRIRVYDEALATLPVALLEPTIRRAIATRQWFPKAAELIADAEAVRLEMRAAMKYDPADCAQCNGSGWETVKVDNVERVTRCGCWLRHQRKVEELGAGAKPLALPAAQERNWTEVGSIE